MKKLLLKKCFFDGWDNLLVLFLNNIGFLAIIGGFIIFKGAFAAECVLFALATFHLCGISGIAFKISRSLGSCMKGYVQGIKKVGHMILFYLLVIVSFFCIKYIIPFYFSYADIVYDALGFFMLFMILLLILALVYFFPLALFLEKDRPLKTLRKCFIVLFDNFGLSFYCIFKDIFDLVISVFTAFLVPGIFGVVINRTTAVSFFMLRYDYMEKEKVSKEYAFADRYLEKVEEEYEERNLRTLFVPWKHSN